MANQPQKALTPNQINQKKLRAYINTMQGEIEKALPSVMTPERFTRICLSAISATPKLADCSLDSFLGAMMNAAQLGLEPNTPLGQAYLIPYAGKCQFQIGYKGLQDLAWRSGEFKNIMVHEVHENDEFDYEYGLEPSLKHKPARSNRGNVIFYYAVYTLTNGGYNFEVLSREDAEAFGKKYSQSYNNGPWKKDFDAMAMKTVLKKLLKFAPIKSDVARVVNEDETIKSSISSDMSTVQSEYVDAEYKEEVIQEQPVQQTQDHVQMAPIHDESEPF